MADEIATVMALRMRDEASAKMKAFSATTQDAARSSLDFKMTLTAVGGALTAVGALVNQIDNPTAKLAATFLMTGGAIMTTTSAILQMIPMIRNLINWLRTLAITQAIVKALMGPVGWAQLGIGLAVAGAATAGIMAATGGFSGGGGGTTQVNIQGGPLIMENDADMRKFGAAINESQRRETQVGR